MGLYRFHVQQISGYFEGCEFKHVPRLENGAADVLSKLGSSRDVVPPDIALEHLRKPSIKPSKESDSIFVPPEPQPDAVSMDIDTRKGKAIMVDPGTAQSESGTSQPRIVDGTSTNQRTTLSQATVSVFVMMAISN